MSDATQDAAILQLDHVVLAVHDLAAASDDFRALGFTVTPGGDHTGRSSHNALIVFDDGAYLELKAWRAPAPDERWWRTLAAHGEGLVDLALWPASVPAAMAAAEARGLQGLRRVPGHRTRPDGMEVKWDTARHDWPDLPFLCADLTPRARRVPQGAARRHANGATGVGAVQIATRDLPATLARHRALLGPAIAIAPCPGPSSSQAARYRLGGTEFELFEPPALAVQALAATDSVASTHPRQHQQALRDGVIALHLRGADQAPAHPLAPARTHGALLTLGAPSPDHPGG